MTQPYPLDFINALRVILSPCGITTHLQMHARPHVDCSRPSGKMVCGICALVTGIIDVKFMWSNGEDGVVDAGWMMVDREERDESPTMQLTHCPACNTRYQPGEFIWLSTNPAVTRRRCLHCEPQEVS